MQPGSGRVGILGGGQLGRMLAMAGARLGLDIVIFDHNADCPASRVATEFIQADTSDHAALADFAKRVDIVTFEFENVSIEALSHAREFAPVRPGRRALEVSQDRVNEKTFLNDLGIATVEFQAVDHDADLQAGLAKLGMPSILKTRRFGYDGKGQLVVRDNDVAQTAFAEIGEQPAILEAFAPFKRELSIIAARGVTGEIAAFPLGENRHEAGILRETRAPAMVSAETQSVASSIATKILEALDYVGVLAVELFELGDGSLLVNEIAPRVHNSGHWTQQGCVVDQFELHLRAICGWPLGDTRAQCDVRMINLIGDDSERWEDWLKKDDHVLHLYGKREARAGRKMGHVNIIERG